MTDLQYKLKTISRINYLACVFKEEFDNQVKIINQRKGFFKFSYYTIDFMVDVNEPVHLEKKYIQIGNSGTPTNNHLDVFQLLEAINFEPSSLLIPLSYGESSYIQLLKEQEQTLAKHEKVFLQDFMSINEYNNFLKQVKVAIFNTRRQQAVGNILALLYYGAKLFISEKSPVYGFLKREGLLIYSYESELKSSNDVQKGLDIDQINFNRNRLEKLFDPQILTAEIESFLSEV